MQKLIGRTNILILCLQFISFLLCAIGIDADAIGEPQIKVDSTIRYQTMHGWSATAEAGQFQESFPLYRDSVFDRAVNQLGINRLQLGIAGSSENPVDFFNPDGPNEERHDIVNDNSDPFTINWAGFHFSGLDSRMNKVVLPMAGRLKARSEKLFLVVTYGDFAQSQFKHKYHPEEYAEFVLATYLHLERTFHRVPDAWEMVLEPDNVGWTAQQIASCLLAAGKRLKQHHFTARFILPSAANMTTSLRMFETIAETPGVLPYIYEFSYHRYAGVTDEALRSIGSHARDAGVSTSMLEHIASGYEDLHRDLKIANVSSWEQYTIAYPGTVDTGGKYYMLNVLDPLHPQVITASRTNFLQQYFHYVRTGAVRIAATTTNRRFNPVAFINKNGKWVVIVKSSDGGSFSVSGLPPGQYGITYTTSTETAIALHDSATSNGKLSTAIPARGVLTIYQKR